MAHSKIIVDYGCSTEETRVVIIGYKHFGGLGEF